MTNINDQFSHGIKNDYLEEYELVFYVIVIFNCVTPTILENYNCHNEVLQFSKFCKLSTFYLQICAG